MRPEDLDREDVMEAWEALDDLDDDDGDDTEAVDELDDDEDGESLAGMEAVDDEDEPDDEDGESLEAEFLPWLLRRRRYRYRSRRPRHFRAFRSAPGHGRGVRGAVVVTPRGRARVRLPREVVPMSLYRKDMKRLTERDNRLVARLNRTQRDLAQTDRKAVRALARATQAGSAVKKLRKEQKSAAAMNLMVSLMQMQRLQSRLESHTHPGPDKPPANSEQGNDSFLLFLPLLLTENGGDDNLLPLMMLMMGMGKPTRED